jgi:hypothetical protein
MTPGRAGVRLFWCFFALYALTSSGNAFRVPDEFEVYFQAAHLADAGTLSIPQTLAITQEGQPIFFGEFGTDGQPYAPYGPGAAFLIEPFHLIGRAVARLAGVPRAPLPAGIAWEVLVGGVTTYASAFAAALAVAGFYRASQALGASRRRGVLLAMILGCATLLWPYATTLYSEAWLAAAFSWAAALLLEARSGDRHARARVIAAATLLAMAILAKPTAVVAAPAFILAALFEPRISVRTRWNVALVLGAAAAAMMAVHIGWNLQRFGRALDFGYNLGAMIPQLPARSFALEDVPRGLFVQLLTPGKSLFVWAPAALLGLLALPATWARERGLAAGVTAAIVATLLFYSAFLFPEGGYAHGPRHLVPLIPLLLLPLCIPGVRWPGRALAVCAAIGFVMAALGASVSFLEDQSSPGTATRISTGPYYERVDPPPGRPWHRYRIDYIPFKFALTSGHWWSADRPVGNGPDFFSLHLARARAALPAGQTIPPWMPWAVALPWALLLAWSAASLRACLRESAVRPRPAVHGN